MKTDVKKFCSLNFLKYTKIFYKKIFKKVLRKFKHHRLKMKITFKKILLNKFLTHFIY